MRYLILLSTIFTGLAVADEKYCRDFAIRVATQIHLKEAYELSYNEALELASKEEAQDMLAVKYVYDFTSEDWKYRSIVPLKVYLNCIQDFEKLKKPD